MGPLVRVSDLPGRRNLRSAAANRLEVPTFKLSTVGSRALPAAGPQIWNNLPEDVTSSPSLSTFRQRLKTVLFRRSYILAYLHDFILVRHDLHIVFLAVSFVTLATLRID